VALADRLRTLLRLGQRAAEEAEVAQPPVAAEAVGGRAHRAHRARLLYMATRRRTVPVLRRRFRAYWARLDWWSAKTERVDRRKRLPHRAAQPQPNVGRTPPSAPDPLVRLFLRSSRPTRVDRGPGASPTKPSQAAETRECCNTCGAGAAVRVPGAAGKRLFLEIAAAEGRPLGLVVRRRRRLRVAR
jgi:hypothetical protein